MQSTTYPPRHATGFSGAILRVVLLLFSVLAGFPPAYAQAISALTVPLLLPTSVAFDAQGNLYIAETNNHVIRRVDPTGVLTTVAGSGTQGFSGDGGPAIAASLDSPMGVVIDSANNVYIADSHNHRVRRIDGVTGVISTVAGNGSLGFSGDGGPANLASLNLPSALAIGAGGDLYIADTNNYRIRKVTIATGVIATVAGNGLQQFSGDGGLATAASIDSPSGLAIDDVGNIYVADTHNHRVRVVSRATGLISTVAGTGVADFSGDGGAAANAALALPRGVSVDVAGNVYIADSNNQRIRRIAADGTITTVAGEGTQTFSGDGGPAAAAGLDTPRSTALSPTGLVTLADTGNDRVRQVSSNNTVTTVAGLGATLPTVLTITVPSAITYGSGSLSAALVGVSATGSVTFFDSVGSGTVMLGTVALANNVAVFSAAALAVGTHHIFSIYSGDLTHASAQSAASAVSVSAAQVVASAASASILYGQQVPALSGSLNGVFAQDAGNVSLVLSTAASTLSPVGTYPIVGTLSGPAAGNYMLAPLADVALTINKAPSMVAVSASSLSVAAGLPLSLTLHVASATSGTPTGSIILLDGGTPLATLPLSANGSAGFTSSTLALGAHLLAASYSGDANFTGSIAAAQTISITPAAAGDFALAATGAATQTVASGSAASFTFAIQMQGTALASPIALAASALPVGMTASFSPAYLPSGGAVTTFTLTVQTSKAAVSRVDQRWFAGSLAGLAVLLLPFAAGWRRRWGGVLMLGVLIATVGCGDRIVSTASSTAALTSYPITVTGTATNPTGAVLQHTATVTLNVQ